MPTNETSINAVIKSNGHKNGSKTPSEKQKNSFDEKDVDTSEDGNSFKTKFSRIEENEIDLREKCDELRRDLETIKTSTEEALLELQKNKACIILLEISVL